jgi:exosortase
MSTDGSLHMQANAGTNRLASSVSAHWRAAIPLILFGLCWIILWPSSSSLIDAWENTDRLTYTHGWLIPLISAWLLSRSFRNFEGPVRFSRAGATLLAFFSLVWLIVLRAGIEVGHQALTPWLMGLTVWAALGWRAARVSAFAFAYLYFAIPVWSLGNGLLQSLTVVVIKALLPIAGIPAYVAGNSVHIAAGDFEIAGGCSGLHFFIVAMAVAALQGEINRDSWRTRTLLLLLAAGLAVVTNWLRVFTIIVAGYLTDMQHFLIQVDHYYFGWVVFAVAIAVFFLLSRRLGHAAPDASEVAVPPARSVHYTWRAVTGIALAFLLLGIGPVWNLLRPLRTASLGANADLPRALVNWDGPLMDPGDSAWRPVIVGADVAMRGNYRREGQEVSLFKAIYLSQEQGNKELIGYNNSVLGQTTATVIGSRSVGETTHPVREIALREADGSISLLWYFYEVDAQKLTSPLLVQLWYGMRSLVSAPVGRVVALRAECKSDCEALRRQMAGFLSAIEFQRVEGT